MLVRLVSTLALALTLAVAGRAATFGQQTPHPAAPRIDPAPETGDMAALRAAVAQAGPAGEVVVERALFIADPAAIRIPEGVTLRFVGEGRLVTGFGSVRRIRMLAHGTGYSAVPAVTIEGPAGIAGVAMGISQFLLASPGTGYRPGDVLSLVGGDAARPAALTVVATQVVSVHVASTGSGGTDGRQMVTGTTGEGVPFQAAVAVEGGRIAAVSALVRPGTYTRNPHDLTAEPVEGGGLRNASLRLEMGVGATLQGRVPGNPAVYVSDFGLYADLPVGDVPLAGGSGHDASLRNVTWHVQEIALAHGRGRHAGMAPRVTISGGSPRFAAQAEAIGDALVIDGRVIAGSRQVFAGSARIAGALGGVPVEAAWFGVDPTGAADSTDALRAWAAAVPAPGGTGLCGPGTYLVSGTILQRSGTTLACDGAASVWKAAASFIGRSVPTYTFPFSSIDNTMLANENYDAPFHPSQKVDHDLTVRAVTFDYSAPSARLVPGNKAVVYRMVRNAGAYDVRCTQVGNCTTMMASDTTRVVRLHARGVANAAADHWESPRNALVEDPDIDMRGDPFGRTLYGVLFTGSDTATRFAMGSGNTLRGGRITGFRDAALWSDDGVEGTTVEGTLIDCAGQDRAVGLYFTGRGGGHAVRGATLRNCSRPVIFTNEQRGAWPRDVTIRDVRVESQRASPAIVLNGAPARESAIAPPLRGTITGGSVRYAPGSPRPSYSILGGGGTRLILRDTSAIDPGSSGVSPVLR